ncbi:MAG TPA: aldo/keto reductase [Nitrososphaeraceae archaeon]|jgi:aryl-alcohol dehydrogenase-like predicted oxidoreductase
MIPIEEMMGALDDMVKSGKILYIGISDAPAWIVSRANTLANLKGWVYMRPNTVKVGSI